MIELGVFSFMSLFTKTLWSNSKNASVKRNSVSEMILLRIGDNVDLPTALEPFIVQGTGCGLATT